MKRRLYLAGFLLHFFLLLLVCSLDTVSILSNGDTFLPPVLEKYWAKTEAAVSVALGKRLEIDNPLRLGVSIYSHAAGIEAGYSFFAPNIPNSRKLVFELRYKDGRREYELPRVSDDAAGFRLTSSLDQIANISYEPLRELLLKMMAFSVWQEHPEAKTIRAVFGYVAVPSPWEMERGKRESYNFLYAYDFSFPPRPDSPNP